MPGGGEIQAFRAASILAGTSAQAHQDGRLLAAGLLARDADVVEAQGEEVDPAQVRQRRPLDAAPPGRLRHGRVHLRHRQVDSAAGEPHGKQGKGCGRCQCQFCRHAPWGAALGPARQAGCEARTRMALPRGQPAAVRRATSQATRTGGGAEEGEAQPSAGVSSSSCGTRGRWSRV